MLNVQQFLMDNSHADLSEQLGIKTCFHDELPLVILNYDQIESPKTDPIVRECRGLVLNSQSHDLVARSFARFFNWGEVADEMPLFNFDDFAVQTKEDGSLVLIYNWNGKWQINTRGSFALDNMQFQDFTWREAILKGLGFSDMTDLDKHLDPKVSYVGEFCSPWNKIVRTYDDPQVYLLTAFEGSGELTHDECDAIAADAHMLTRPERHDFTSMEQVQDYLAEMSESDPTYEGVVIRDVNNHRWKIKSPTYLGLHKMRGEGDNMFNPKHLIPFIMTGETDELLTYFPEVEEKYREYEDQVNEQYADLLAVMNSVQGIDDQKEFALAVQGRTKFTGLLFQLRKEHGAVIPESALRKKWRDSSAMILKFVFKK